MKNIDRIDSISACAGPLWQRLVFTLSCLGFVLATHAQDLPYSSGSTGEDGPFTIPQSYSPGRSGHGMAFDAARGEMVLFGGGNGNSLLSDTWTWRGSNWVLRQPANHPSGRSGLRMVYDAARSQVVLFGGVDPYLRNETWVWDGSNWSDVTPSNSPPARRLHAMTYDSARRETVLFGGYLTNDALSDETWVWNGTNWAQKIPNVKPSARAVFAMTFDEARGVAVLFGGYVGPFGPYSGTNDTLLWDGTNWTQAIPPIAPGIGWGHTAAYDAVRHEVLLSGGGFGGGGDETWAWDGTNWSQRGKDPNVGGGAVTAYDSVRQKVVRTGGALTIQFSPIIVDTAVWESGNWYSRGPAIYHFDMRGRPNGVWNFTTIDIARMSIYFIKNAENTPVRWLASGNVNIGGALFLNGESRVADGILVEAPKGGPGGYSGGPGGLPSFQGSSPAGHPGQGPGGGQPGLLTGQNGQPGTYATTYGNAFLQPLLGGSGGGGGAAQNNGSPGYSGGGGGGAIEIASSRDMFISGAIQANGGVSYPGSGSGGAIRLQADRIIMQSGSGLSAVPDGRIWLGCYERQLGGSISPANVPNTVLGVPVGTLFPDTLASALAITNVAGQYVMQPPGGSLVAPDVTFTQSGDITVTVSAPTLPAGTPVRLRLTMAGQVIERPPVTLAGGVASFTLTVPQGKGTLQALADLSAP